MAKSTVHGGESYTEHELSDPDAPPRIRRFQIGGERPSAGSNSRRSGRRQELSDSTASQIPPSPAPMTESPSEVPDKETPANARSTGGSGRRTRQPQSGKKSNTDDDFDF